MMNIVLCSELVSTASPMNTFSNGFNSMRRVISVNPSKARQVIYFFEDGGGGLIPAAIILSRLWDLAQQLEHALLRLVGKRERGHRDRLAGGQRLAVRRFLVGVGKGEVRRTDLQHS